jgi:transposase
MPKWAKIEQTVRSEFRDIVAKKSHCPRCGNPANRHSTGFRQLMDLGKTEQVLIRLRYGKYFCKKCVRHFNQSMTDLAQKGCAYTHQVRSKAMELLKEDKTFAEVSAILKRDHFVNISATSIFDWKKAAEKKR